ncbi:MAG: transglycosylase SLT domain-containing protein [Desulfobacterales bacterium]|nr:transglycosylase SLT domain-containing protein [Desulfobacterales bacterium]MDJ0988952.1 transglycosylase SLT domain-containing protein [Desulfobacterales bacterium]
MRHRWRGLTCCAAVMVAVLLAGAAPTRAFERYNRVKKFDPYFAKYTKRFFGPAFDWRHFKAQAVAESRLQADAKSHVGAVGVMQIMPRTFEEIRRKQPAIKGSRFQPRWNIAAGIYYDRQLWNTWKAERPFRDRLNFTFGAFNAGKANIIKAQKVAAKDGLDPNRWTSIEKKLPAVTGKHSRETIGYVEKIELITEVLH